MDFILLREGQPAPILCLTRLSSIGWGREGEGGRAHSLPTTMPAAAFPLPASLPTSPLHSTSLYILYYTHKTMFVVACVAVSWATHARETSYHCFPMPLFTPPLPPFLVIPPHYSRRRGREDIVPVPLHIVAHTYHPLQPHITTYCSVDLQARHHAFQAASALQFPASFSPIPPYLPVGWTILLLPFLPSLVRRRRREGRRRRGGRKEVEEEK